MNLYTALHMGPWAGHCVLSIQRFCVQEGGDPLSYLASTCPSAGHLELIIMVVQGLVPRGGHLESLSPLGSASVCLWCLFNVDWSNTQQVGSMGIWALVSISVPVAGDGDA